MVQATGTASCPACGREAPSGAVDCEGCGFALFDERRAAPRLRRLRRWQVGVALALAVAAAVSVIVVTREGTPAPPQPLSAPQAEVRLEHALRAGGLSDADSVTCAGVVRRGRLTRCQVGYTDGDVQLILVQLAADGGLDIENPYPAQRRPG